jgi:hypothetical protein
MNGKVLADFLRVHPFNRLKRNHSFDTVLLYSHHAPLAGVSADQKIS